MAGAGAVAVGWAVEDGGWARASNRVDGWGSNAAADPAAGATEDRWRTVAVAKKLLRRIVEEDELVTGSRR